MPFGIDICRLLLSAGRVGGWGLGCEGSRLEGGYLGRKWLVGEGKLYLLLG